MSAKFKETKVKRIFSMLNEFAINVSKHIPKCLNFLPYSFENLNNFTFSPSGFWILVYLSFKQLPMRLLIFLLFVLLVPTVHSQTKDFKVIAYYSGNAQQIDNYQLDKITHIIYCFSHLKGNQLDVGGAQSIATIKKLVSLKKQHPQLKVLLSLGGWGGCKSCSEVFSKADDRLAFAKSVKDVLVKYCADGIDLDWEYPAVEGPPGHPFKAEDRENFTDLLARLRQELGNKYILSFAAGGFEDYMANAIEWKKAADLVDFINLMSYDLVNGYSKVTGHHTPLYSTPEQLLSVDYGVKEMMRQGVPANKIVIGLAFYGRVWENVANNNSGIYQAGNFKKSESIVKIDNLLNNSDYEVFWDDKAKAPYIYNSSEKLFITYDNKKSVGLKTAYALEHGLGGVMFWQLGLDYSKNGLLQEIDSTVNKWR